MRDMISCEEVFEADPQARAEFDAVCDEWQDEAILAQDAEEDLVECTGVASSGFAQRVTRVTPSTGVASATKAILTTAKNRLTWHGFCGPRVNDNEKLKGYLSESYL